MQQPKVLYTHTAYGLLPQPLMEKPVKEDYTNSGDCEHYYNLDLRWHLSWIKTNCIPVTEDFEKKIPIGTENLEKDVHFELKPVYRFNEGHYMGKCSICTKEFWNADKRQFVCQTCCNNVVVAIPLVDIVNSSKPAEVTPVYRPL